MPIYPLRAFFSERGESFSDQALLFPFAFSADIEPRGAERQPAFAFGLEERVPEESALVCCFHSWRRVSSVRNTPRHSGFWQ